MRDEAEIKARIAALEAEYDVHDPPVTPADDETEVALLRAIEELEWVLEERGDDASFTG